MLRLILALSFFASAASAQDTLAQARNTYDSLQGEWAEPSKGCSNPVDTWSFGPGTVRAGQSRFELLGIGGASGAIRVDLISQGSGARVPLNIVRSGGSLEVTGSGIAVRLTRCDAAFAQEDVTEPTLPQEDTITSTALDEEAGADDAGPSTDELREALGEPSIDAASDDIAETADSGLEDTSAETAFASRFSGAWASAAGTCDWRLSESRITAAGESYDVVNYSGSADRIGIQALRSDGTPATFTVTSTGAGPSVNGAVAGGDPVSATLSPC